MQSFYSFYGVTFCPSVQGKKQFRAQINRASKLYFIGYFESSMDAARAWDNVSYYTRAWTKRTLALNFPQEWEQEAIPPTAKALEIMADLRARFPNLERQLQVDETLSAAEQLEIVARESVRSIKISLSALEAKVGETVGKLKMAELQNAELQKELEKRDRIIEGLRNQGGHHFFKKVGGESVPASQVENHLG